ncbi:hypothetical protein [Lactobacillus sp. ESL0225]|uniref:hypothetical protein n=1 Tax=Lactobacillus sp. ESL0225 TaxID=2069351 RepID=UPI000EFC3080|nr:hypothetical protein [Lactobacillus sp. ESL0225]RMC47725.1 hypothetical protein F5ESL0225_08170 [Lactobacillus sp. ESL0225]
MKKEINFVQLVGTVMQDPKPLKSNLFKWTLRTNDKTRLGKDVHAYIPVASNYEPTKGDTVIVTGKITTASQKNEDGSYTNFWNVLADEVTKAKPSEHYWQPNNPDTLQKAANKIKNFNETNNQINDETINTTKPTNNKKDLTAKDKLKAIKLAKQLLSEYGE